MTFRHSFPAIATAIALALPTALSAQETPDANTVMATVNGTDITLGHMIVLKQRLPAQYQQLPPEVLFEGILDQLIQQTLLAAEVQELSTGSRLTLDNESRALRANEAITDLVASAVSDEALQAAYDTTYGNAEPETEYNASHILVPTEDEAKAIVTELEGGADFAEVAMAKSTGPSGPRGGELGWFEKGAMVEPFEEAVMAMEVGTISAPVQTQFGWHVIRLNETRNAEAPALDEVRAELAEQLQRAAIDARIQELTGAAQVTRRTANDVDPALLDNLELLEN